MSELIAAATDRFLELSAECFDPLLERVDLVSELGHRSSVVVALRAQLLQHPRQLPVLGVQLASSSLLRLQLRLHVTQLINIITRICAVPVTDCGRPME